ncbi:hypothetical protein EPD60_01510 [Flaviaesturariibacter flavus]|uniref:Uncharacterized protein n=1 Tax=Flaviaesturariibacter flavus TaxID=2502780 RepID=A0A4R1BNW4_9BACT|nr:hypothetical protein [Flaviaesturariibacter flavus]TCJ19118.1 hypothetical protein EPD60_01510 [Flaviaesturariibacter flavus]
MYPDPKEEPEKQPVPPSETVANAHAAGDGALERSDGTIEGGTAGPNSPELHAEDQDHKPY